MKKYALLFSAVLLLVGCSETEYPYEDALPSMTEAAETVCTEAEPETSETPFGEYKINNTIRDKNRAMLGGDIPVYDESIVGQYLCVENDEEKRKAIMKEICDLTDEICEGCVSDIGKVRRIAEWVSDNVYYDFDASKSSVGIDIINADNILHNGMKTTCGGYSNLVSLMCASQNIECINMRGGTASGGHKRDELEDVPINHEWNAVLIDDEWHFIDTTWASVIFYHNGEYKVGEKYVDVDFYMDFGFYPMCIEHRIDIIEKRDYSYYLGGDENE